MSFSPDQYFYYYNQYPASYLNGYPMLKQDQNQNQTKYIESLEWQNKLLRQKVKQLEEKLKEFQQISLQNDEQIIKKPKRQTKNSTIEHKCKYESCDRSYKSSLALNLHMKMKHNGGSIRERQAYAKLICECEIDGKPTPQININFPPNFLQNYKRRILKTKSASKDSQC